MAYKNKTYVCFDADTDMRYYNLMRAWKENDEIAFDFQNAHDLNNVRDGSSEAAIKAKLRERLLNTKVLIVLVGEKTRHLYKFVKWEIEYAIEKDIPIIVSNLNGLKKMDYTLCPPILRDELAIHISYGPNIINFALNNWVVWHPKHRSDKKTGAFFYEDRIYESIKNQNNIK